MNRFIVFALVLLLCGVARAQQDRTITISSGGIQRSFDVHLPSAAPPAMLPVLLCYHGTGGTAQGMKSVTGFNVLADANNFIVVYPQAVKIGNDVQWNVYVDGMPGHAGVGVDDAPDDVLFTRDIIAYLATNFTVDVSRVYASGLSNGGFMCYALSMLAADDIAAIAPVAANMWADEQFLTDLITIGNVREIPVLHVHGTADATVEYPDKDGVPKDYEEYPLFVAGRTCNAVTYSAVMPVMNGVDKLVFCPPPVEVSLIRISGMGHTWSNGMYPTSSEIVDFFGLKNTTAVAQDATGDRQFTLSPNPARSTILVQLPSASLVQLVSSIGTIVSSAEYAGRFADILCSGLPGGLYFVRIQPLRGGEVLTKAVMVTGGR